MLVHTGPDFVPSLGDVLFSELDVRPPDHYLGTRAASFAEQVGRIISGIDPLEKIDSRSDRDLGTLPSSWQAPEGYLVEHVSTAVAKIVLGYTSIRTHLS